jgi:hypothetical protein
MAIVGIVLVLLVVIVTRPDDFHVERSAQIDASPEVVFAIVNNLHNWNEWSPYDKYDPNMKKTFSGPDTGPGASYAWSGNDNVGEGRMTIEESKPAELVGMKLEFIRPFAGINRVNFRIAPSEAGSRISWVMDGKNKFMSKAISLMMNMDTMVGKDFEQGLANLNKFALRETLRISRESNPEPAVPEDKSVPANGTP